jgi:MCP family monocarboxylic acid transporter-like MFS transporter 10
MGLFDGCFVSLLGPIAYDLCGGHGAAQAIGFLLGLCSFGLTAGPVIAGEIYDDTKSYTLPFILAGIPPIVGATLMFLIRCVKDERIKPNEMMVREAEPLQIMPHIAWDEGN